MQNLPQIFIGYAALLSSLHAKGKALPREALTLSWLPLALLSAVDKAAIWFCSKQWKSVVAFSPEDSQSRFHEWLGLAHQVH